MNYVLKFERKKTHHMSTWMWVPLSTNVFSPCKT